MSIVSQSMPSMFVAREYIAPIIRKSQQVATFVGLQVHPVHTCMNMIIQHSLRRVIVQHGCSVSISVNVCCRIVFVVSTHSIERPIVVEGLPVV